MGSCDCWRWNATEENRAKKKWQSQALAEAYWVRAWIWRPFWFGCDYTFFCCCCSSCILSGVWFMSLVSILDHVIFWLVENDQRDKIKKKDQRHNTKKMTESSAHPSLLGERWLLSFLGCFAVVFVLVPGLLVCCHWFRSYIMWLCWLFLYSRTLPKR